MSLCPQRSASGLISFVVWRNGSVVIVWTALVSRATIDHLKSVFSAHGTDAWWSLPIEELLPNDVIVKVAF